MTVQENVEFYQEISFEDVSETRKKIKLKIDSGYFSKLYQKELNQTASKATFKGFRPGKVPKAMVEKLHGSNVQIQTIDGVVNSSVQEFARKKSLDVINVTELDIDPKNFGPQSPAMADGLEFTAVLVLYPKPEIKDYSEVKVSVEKAEIGEKEVQDAIDNIRKSKASLKAVTDREVPTEDDVVSAEVLIAVNGEAAGRPEPMTTELKDQNLPEAVRQELLKTKIGETKEVEVDFPGSYPEASLRGKSGKYTFTLKGISERQLPEVDDEFAKGCGMGAETAEELKTKVRAALDEELDKRVGNDVEVAILKEISTANPFEVPQELIDDEIRNLAVRFGFVDPNKTDVRRMPVESLRSGLGEIALERVKAVIVVDRIAEKESLSAKPDEMDSKIKEMATTYGIPEEEVRKFVFQDGRGVNMIMDITRTKVMEFLKKTAKIEYTKPEEKKA